MRESSTYQVILAEGRVEGRIEEAQDIVLRLGSKRFGPPDERVQATIRSIDSRERLELLSERLRGHGPRERERECGERRQPSHHSRSPTPPFSAPLSGLFGAV